MRIVLTAYDRPEFLKETIRTLNAAQEHLEGGYVPVHVYVDLHDDHEVHNDVIEATEGILGIDEIVLRRDNYGGSRNNAMALAETYRLTGDNDLIYLESDVVVANGFLSWMRNISNAMGEHNNIMQFSAGHPAISRTEHGCVLAQWPSSIGVMFNMRNMAFFLDRIDQYIDDPNGTALGLRDLVAGNMVHRMYTGDTYFNHAWGGMLALNMGMTNTYCLHSTPPRACHIGWHGWHLNKASQEAKGITRPEDHAQYTKGFSESTI